MAKSKFQAGQNVIIKAEGTDLTGVYQSEIQTICGRKYLIEVDGQIRTFDRSRVNLMDISESNNETKVNDKTLALISELNEELEQLGLARTAGEMTEGEYLHKAMQIEGLLDDLHNEITN